MTQNDYGSTLAVGWKIDGHIMLLGCVEKGKNEKFGAHQGLPKLSENTPRSNPSMSPSGGPTPTRLSSVRSPR